MIRFESVTKRYDGGSEALRGVSLELHSGEFAFLTGHSGAGKMWPHSTNDGYAPGASR